MNKILSTIFILFIFTIIPACNAITLQDEFANKLPKDVKQPTIYNNYNFESTEKLPIKLHIIKPIKSENDIKEGEEVKFKVTHNVYHNDLLLVKKGTIAKANVNVIISTGMNGIPASIIFNNFQIEGLKSSRFENTCEIFGQDRSLWVFPLKWALTPLPPTGSLTNFIKGGHVTVKPSKEITIYYHPMWQ